MLSSSLKQALHLASRTLSGSPPTVLASLSLALGEWEPAHSFLESCGVHSPTLCSFLPIKSQSSNTSCLPRSSTLFLQSLAPDCLIKSLCRHLTDSYCGEKTLKRPLDSKDISVSQAQSVLKETNPEYSLEGLMLMLKINTSAT